MFLFEDTLINKYYWFTNVKLTALQLMTEWTHLAFHIFSGFPLEGTARTSYT